MKKLSKLVVFAIVSLVFSGLVLSVDFTDLEDEVVEEKTRGQQSDGQVGEVDSRDELKEEVIEKMENRTEELEKNMSLQHDRKKSGLLTSLFGLFGK